MWSVQFKSHSLTQIGPCEPVLDDCVGKPSGWSIYYRSHTCMAFLQCVSSSDASGFLSWRTICCRCNSVDLQDLQHKISLQSQQSLQNMYLYKSIGWKVKLLNTNTSKYWPSHCCLYLYKNLFLAFLTRVIKTPSR